MPTITETRQCMTFKLGNESSIEAAQVCEVLGISEITQLEPANIDPAPRIAMRWRTEFIQGTGKRGGGFVTLLAAARSSRRMKWRGSRQPGANGAAPRHNVAAADGMPRG